MKKKSFVVLFSALACCIFLVVGLLFFVLRNNFQPIEKPDSTTQNDKVGQKTPELVKSFAVTDSSQFESEIASIQLAKYGQIGFSNATFKDKNTIEAIAYQEIGGMQKISLDAEKLNVITKNPFELLNLDGIREENKSFLLREQKVNVSSIDGEYLIMRDSDRNFEIYSIADQSLVSKIPSDIKVVDQKDKTEFNLQYYRGLLSSSAFNVKSNIAAVQTENQIKIYDLQSAQLKSTLNITKLQPSKVLEKLLADKNQDGFAYTFAFVGGFDTKMAFSPDGSKLAVMRQQLDLESTDNSFTTSTVVDIYDLNNKKKETIYDNSTSRQPQSDSDKATNGIIKFDKSGANVIFSLPQRDVAIYNFTSKTLVQYTGSQTLITAIAVNDNSNILAIGDVSGYINVWDIDRQKLLKSFKAHNNNIALLEFAKDSKSLLSLGAFDQKLSLWGRKQEQKPSQNIINPLFDIQTSDVQNPNVFTDDFVFSKDSKKLYTTNYQQEVQMWDLETQKKIWSQKNSENTDIGLSDDGSRLVVVGPNDGATTLNAVTGQVIMTKGLCPQRHQRVIAMNPNSDSFVINCEVGLIVYDIDTLEQINIITLGARRGFGFSKDGKYFISAGDFESDNIMEIYDSNFKLIKDIQKQDYNPASLVVDTFLIADSISFSPDNSTIAAYSPREFLSLFDYTTYEKKANLVLPDSADINSVAFHPNNIHVVTGDRNGGINIWNIRSGSILQTVLYPGEIKKVLFSPDGTKMIVAGESGLVKVFDVNAGN